MMISPSKHQSGALELIEEGFHLLRTAPLVLFVSYYIGAVPFVLAVLFFWSDMSRGAFAEERLLLEVAAVTALFFWMKAWQAVFARQLRSQIIGKPLPPLTFGKIARGVITQAIFQPSGLFLMPLAIVLLFPIAWVFSFYQNVTAFGGFDDSREVFRKSLRASAAWPRQNNYVVFLFKAFGFFVFLNIFTGVLAVPLLLATLFGIETVFVQSPWTFFNTTFFAAICAVTYLCVDPVAKAVYTLRCFYLDSRETGEDLRVELRSFSSAPALAAVFVAFSLLFAAGALAQDESPPKTVARSSTVSVAPGELNRAMDQVLERPEYTWRLPRQKRVEAKQKGPVGDFFKSISDTLEAWSRQVKSWIDKYNRWLNRGRPSVPSSPGRGLALDWLFSVRGLILLLLFIVVALLIFLLYRLWRHREPSTGEIAAQPLAPVPDLAQEDVAADQLPEDGWIAMGRDFLARGDLRLALRAFYLASLAQLAQRNLVTIARHQSNRDYERELSRRAHALPQVAATFTENVSVFERIWYGMHEVNESLLREFESNVEKLKAS